MSSRSQESGVEEANAISVRMQAKNTAVVWGGVKVNVSFQEYRSSVLSAPRGNFTQSEGWSFRQALRDSN